MTVRIGSNLFAGAIDALGINGVGLAEPGHAIGIRGIPLLPHHGRFDGKLPIVTLCEKGPYHPDGKYHHTAFRVPVVQEAVDRFLRLEFFAQNAPFQFDFSDHEAATLQLCWTCDGQSVRGRFSTTLPLDFMLLANGCVAAAEVVDLAAARLTMTQESFTVHIAYNAPAARHATAASVDALEACLRGHLAQANGRQLAGHLVRLTPEQPAYFALGLSPISADPAEIERLLAAGEQDCLRRQMTSTGAVADCADAVARLVGFAANYHPALRQRHVPVNRDWAVPNGPAPIFMWDNFFTSYLAAVFDPDLGRESLLSIVEVIEQKGLADAPPQRNLIVPIVYAKLVRFIGDAGLAARTFPAMMSFMRFWFEPRPDGHPWRDGNDDGLIECGSFLTPDQAPLATIVSSAFDETGYDDSPMYSGGFAYQRGGIFAPGVEYDFRRGTLNLTMIGQNSLYVAACRAMALVADWLTRPDDARWLRAEAERVATRIRERLFSPELGYFQNRFFNGAFSPVKTMTIFYPLLADLCDRQVQDRLRNILLDPNQFWGDNVIPTVSRDDPAYVKDPWRDDYWLGNYWRGNVWPPTNYITWLALRQAGWDDVAAAFAKKSIRMFMDDWRPRQHAMENYPPAGRTDQYHCWFGNGGRDPHYIWSGLLPLLGLEQLFSVEDLAPGCRFGTLHPEAFGTWTGFIYHGHRATISAGPDGVSFQLGDWLSFRTAAPAEIREMVVAEQQVAFRGRAACPCNWELQLAGQTATGRISPQESLFKLQLCQEK